MGSFISYETTFYVVANSSDVLVLATDDGSINNFKVPPQYNYFSLQMIGGSGQGGGGGGGDDGTAQEYGNGGGGGGGGGYIIGTINLPGPNIILNMAVNTLFAGPVDGGGGGFVTLPGTGGTNGANGTGGANGSPVTLAITGSQAYTILAGAGGGGRGGRGTSTPGPAAAGGTRGEFTIPVALSQLTGTRGTAGADGEAGGTGTGNYGLGGAGGQAGVSFLPGGGTGGSGGSIAGYNGTNGANGFPQVFNIIISKTSTLPPPTIVSLISTPTMPIANQPVTFEADISGTFIYVSQAWSVNGVPFTSNTPLSLEFPSGRSAGKHDISYSLTTTSTTVTYTQSIYVVAAEGDTINILSTDGPLYNYKIPASYGILTYCLIGGGGGGMKGENGTPNLNNGRSGGNGSHKGQITNSSTDITVSPGQSIVATAGTGGISNTDGQNTQLILNGGTAIIAVGGLAGGGGPGSGSDNTDGGAGGMGDNGQIDPIDNANYFGAGGGGGGGGGSNKDSPGQGGPGGAGGGGSAIGVGYGLSGSKGGDQGSGSETPAEGGPGGRGGNGFYRITLKPAPPTPLEFTSHGGTALPNPYSIPTGYNRMEYVLVGAGGAGTDGEGSNGELGGNGGNGGGITSSIEDSSTIVVANKSLEVIQGLGVTLSSGENTTLRYDNQNIAYSYGGVLGTGQRGETVYSGVDGGLGGVGYDGLLVKGGTLRVGAGGGGGGGGNGENGSGGTGGQAGQQSSSEGATAGSNGANQMVGLGGKGGDGFYYIRLSYQAPQ